MNWDVIWFLSLVISFLTYATFWCVEFLHVVDLYEKKQLHAYKTPKRLYVAMAPFIIMIATGLIRLV